MEKERITVLQSFYMYLPVTLNSLYRLISNLEEIDNIIISKEFTYSNFYDIRFKYIEFPLKEISVKNRSFKIKAVNKLIRIIRDRLYGRYIKFILENENIRPAIIHSHFGTQGWFDLRLAKLLNIKHIVSFYGFDYEKIPYIDPGWNSRYEVLFKKADIFICEGNHGKNILIKKGCPEEKIKIIRLGVEVDKIPFYQREKKRKELKLLQIASFREKKGYIYTIEAFSRALKDCPDMSLTLVGEGEEKNKIEKIIKAKGLKNKIKIFNQIEFSKLYEFMKDYQVFIHPSCYAKDMDCEGGAPVVLLDAQATGMPVISTTHCDIPEEVKHTKTGFLAPEKDIESLTKYIKVFYEMDNETYQKFSIEARKHIERFYNIRKNSKLLKEFYYNLVYKF